MNMRKKYAITGQLTESSEQLLKLTVTVGRAFESFSEQISFVSRPEQLWHVHLRGTLVIEGFEHAACNIRLHTIHTVVRAVFGWPQT